LAITGGFAELDIGVEADQRHFTWLLAGDAVVSLAFQTVLTVAITAIDVGPLFEYFGGHSARVTVLFHQPVILGVHLDNSEERENLRRTGGDGWVDHVQ